MTAPIPFVPRVATADPDPDVVQRCRELLARAESGEMRGICYGLALADGRVSHGWYAADGAVNRNDIIASITILQAALVRDALDSSTEA